MARRGRKWYVDLFRDGFYQSWAPQERFGRAESEVDFIVEALDLPSGAPILDLCCGEGRHTIALARRAYRMTGLDLSSLHLRQARRAARDAGVDVRWHRADMRDIPWRRAFSAVINMFTAFGYFESDEEDAKVLRAVCRSLKPGGCFLLDTMNREWLMRHWEPRSWTEADDGTLLLEERRFDALSGRNFARILRVHPDGTREERGIELRLYTLREMVQMMREAGLEVRRTWGGFDGSDYDIDSRRMIVLAEKRSG